LLTQLESQCLLAKIDNNELYALLQFTTNNIATHAFHSHAVAIHNTNDYTARS